MPIKYHIVFIVIIIALFTGIQKYKQFNGSPTGVAETNPMIVVDNPQPQSTIENPVVITGRARGNWFFEASFPIFIVNWDGLIIGQGIATAKAPWMTTEFVPFEANITYEQPTYKNNGAIILKRDNPSDLPENDAAIEIPIYFANVK